MKDNFSTQSAAYARFRPVYPPELYDFLCSLPAQKQQAWDAGTGNGQVAAVLAQHFEQVYATDISAEQIQKAPQIPNITYVVESADTVSLPDQSVDLITVAQAIHWFNFDAFYAEVQRVLRPGGLLAVWGYNLLRCKPAIDSLLDHYYTHVIGPYWDAERKHIDAAYQTIPFPFPETTAPEFNMSYRWTKAHFLGYLTTWSAYQHYIRANQTDPIPNFARQLDVVWPDNEEKNVRFPIFMKLWICK